MKRKNNVVYFKSRYRKEFIESRSRKYNMPPDLVEALVHNQELWGFDVLSESGRIYIEDCLSINAIRHHQ